MSKKRQYSDFIKDILQAIQDINTITSAMSYEEFINNIAVYRATERFFEIIGEASNRIPRDIQQRYEEIPWKDMTSMRNIVIHAYDRVEPDILWDTFKKEFPLLVEPLKKVLEDLNKLEQDEK